MMELGDDQAKKDRGGFEPLLTEHGYACRTGHVLNVSISFGTRDGTDGFLFDVEDDNYKTYHHFMPLMYAMVDLRVNMLSLTPRASESRKHIAQTLLGLLKLENSKTDGRKLCLLFEPMAEPQAPKIRSPLSKTKMGQSRKKKVVEQRPSMTQSIVSAGSETAKLAADFGMTGGSTKSSDKPQSSSRPRLDSQRSSSSRDVISTMTLKTEKLMWGSAHKVFLSETTLKGVRYEVTFFDEADSLLIVLHGIDDESLVYRLLMREGHFWAMFGVKTVEALTKLGDMAGHYHRIRDALTLEPLPDGSQVLGLPEQFLPQAATTGGDSRPSTPNRNSSSLDSARARSPDPASTPVRGSDPPAPRPSTPKQAPATPKAQPATATQAEAQPGKDEEQAAPSEPVLYLMTQEKSLSDGGLYTLSLEEREADGCIVARATAKGKQEPGPLEVRIDDADLRRLYRFDTLVSLPLMGKAELCAKLLDRLDTTDGKQLILHRSRRHVPRRVAAAERRKILRFVRQEQEQQALADDASSVGPMESVSSGHTGSTSGHSGSSSSVVSEGMGGTAPLTGRDDLSVIAEEDDDASSIETLVAQRERPYYELLVRAMKLGESEVLTTMYDEGDGLRVVCQELYTPASRAEEDRLVLPRVPRDDLLLLGCERFRDLGLDQKVEVAEKLCGCLTLDKRGAKRRALAVRVTQPSPLLTLLTRGATLQSQFAVVVSFRGSDDRLEVEAKDVLDSSQRQTLALSPAKDLAGFGGDGFAALGLSERVAVCERVLACLELRVDEDGVGRSLVLNRPDSAVPVYKTVTFVVSCAEPLLLGSLPPPHPRISAEEMRRMRRRRKPQTDRESRPETEEQHDASSEAAGQDEQGEGQQAKAGDEEPSRACVVLRRTRAFGDRVLHITVLEVPPTGVVRAYDPRSGESQHLLLDSDLLRLLGCSSGFMALPFKERLRLCESVVDRLVLVGGAQARIAVQVEQQPPELPVLASKEVAGAGGGDAVTVSVLDGQETAVVVARHGETELRQVLSYADMEELGCHDYGYLDEEERKQLARRILQQQAAGTAAPLLQQQHADLTPDLRLFLQSYFPPVAAGVVDAAPWDKSMPLGVSSRLSVRRQFAGAEFSVDVKEAGPQPALVFEDQQRPESCFTVTLTDSDCRALGFKSVAQALRRENLRSSGPRLVAGVQVRMLQLSNGPLLAALPRAIARLSAEEELAKVDYLFVQEGHVIRGQVYDIMVVVESPTELRVRAEEQQGQGAVLDMLLSPSQLAMLVRGGKVENLGEEKRLAMGQKLLHGLDVIGGGLKFAIRRAAQKQVVANDKADLLTVPRPPRPHVKRYLRELRTLYPDNAWTAPTASGLSAEGREGDTAREHGETGGMDARLKAMVVVPPPTGVRTANEMWGFKKNYVLDPYAEVLSHKHSSIGSFRKRGIKARTFPYVTYWEDKVASLIEYFSCERSLRKAISIVRQTQGQGHVSNKEAFCALAATDGSVTEACGKLRHVDFYKEIQLVGKIINLDKYKKLLVSDRTLFASMSPPQRSMSIVSDASSPLSAAPSFIFPHQAANNMPSRRTSSMVMGPNHQRRASTVGGGHKKSSADITRADFMSLFAPSCDGLVTLSGSTSSMMPASTRPFTTMSSMREQGSLMHDGGISVSCGSASTAANNNKGPTSRVLRQLLDSKLLSQREVDMEEFRCLSASIREYRRTYPSPVAKRPYTVTGVSRIQVPTVDSDCCFLQLSGLASAPRSNDQLRQHSSHSSL